MNKTYPNTKRILIMEDEIFWVKLLIVRLKEKGIKIQITHAKNGEEGVAYIKKNLSSPKSEPPYNAIITDIDMPIMDGRKAVTIIRDLHYTAPIIIWSSLQNSEEDLTTSLELPVNGYCIKEIDLYNVISALRDLEIIE